MTGSSLAPVIIPIVVSISLAAWLIMVYYAASHPGWKSARPSSAAASQALAEVSPAPGHETAGPAVAPAGLPGAGNDQLEHQPRQRDSVSA
jgi:hypothetical protein